MLEKEVQQKAIIVAILVAAIIAIGYIATKFVSPGSPIYKGVVGSVAILSIFAIVKAIQLIKSYARLLRDRVDKNH